MMSPPQSTIFGQTEVDIDRLSYQCLLGHDQPRNATVNGESIHISLLVFDIYCLISTAPSEVEAPVTI